MHCDLAAKIHKFFAGFAKTQVFGFQCYAKLLTTDLRPILCFAHTKIGCWFAKVAIFYYMFL